MPFITVMEFVALVKSVPTARSLIQEPFFPQQLVHFFYIWIPFYYFTVAISILLLPSALFAFHFLFL